MAKKKKDKDQNASADAPQVDGDSQHSLAVNPHDPDFENDGTSGAKNPHSEQE